MVLTTSGAPEHVDRSHRGHANAYVTKPVNLDDFTRAVHRIDSFFLDAATSVSPHQVG